MVELSYKAVGFQLDELKDRGDGWQFSGFASTFNNVDLGGDVVLRGAFRESLKHLKPRLLWQHDMGEPIGVVSSLEENERGLFGNFKLSKTHRGGDAYQLLKDGAVDSMSIGYIPVDVEFDEDGVRQLKSVDLLEVSIVSMAMNPEALITAVKAMQRLPLSAHADRLLEDVRAFSSRYRELADLRARDGRQPGEAVRRAVEELKALAAELEIIPEPVTAPAAEPPPATEEKRPGLHSTIARLEIARRRLRHAGLLEHTA